MSEQPPKENHLKDQTSPYLLQYVKSPVDWYPWGNQAFQRAKELDRPIFLSVGYATCHWCHVMAAETFSDEDVASILNNAFVSIKVDREEMPQIDRIYMDIAKVIMSMQGGWPLNVFLTPELKPFYAVTYMPPVSMRGIMGLTEVASHVKQLWSSQEREELLRDADYLVEAIQKQELLKAEAHFPDKQELEKLFDLFYKEMDTLFGGISGSPKFPMFHMYPVLFSESYLSEDARGIYIAEIGLSKMAYGGIYDHIGGGFARYSLDVKWEIPHFEKQLIDQALALEAYTHAYRATRKPLYQKVAREIFSYMKRELLSKEGGFYTGEDADTDGEEGKYYTWAIEEVERVLEEEEFILAKEYFRISERGNFLGKNVLHIPVEPEVFAQNANCNQQELESKIERILEKLGDARNKKTKPPTDDQIVAAYNAYVIRALSSYSLVFSEEEAGTLAKETMNFLLVHFFEEGKVKRCFSAKAAKHEAVFTDYAYIISSLITLFSHGGGAQYLSLALELASFVDVHYRDISGGYYLTRQDEESILFRKCEISDGSEPSSNSIHAENLVRLFQITRDRTFLIKAEEIFRVLQPQLVHSVQGATFALGALLRYYDKSASVFILVGAKDEREITEVRKALSQSAHPHITCIVKNQEIEEILPFLSSYPEINGKVTLHICQGNQCKDPIVGLDAIVMHISSYS